MLQFPTHREIRMNPDVSVVLNLHREAPYVLRAIRSLNEAARYARQLGIRCELVAVLDRPDQLTRDALVHADCSGFERVVHVEADHGSLGPARNTGIAASTGSYVWTADGDDLVSFNCISAMYELARNAGEAVIFPEYLVAFGEAHWITRYHDDSVVEAADFVAGHPYISRIFVRRDAFADLQYEDLRLSRGFAYEDWHLNCELKARGFRFLIARGTVFYYRQRRGSLLRAAEAQSSRQIPHSRLFTPKVMLEQSAPDQGKRLEAQGQHPGKVSAAEASPREEFLADPACLELTYAAIAVDPSLNLELLEKGGSWATVFPQSHWGHDYVTACAHVGAEPFSDIVLLPSLHAGGGEHFILNVLASLAQEAPDFRCLVIAGEAVGPHAWRGRLPRGSVFLDVCERFPSLDENERDQLVLRLVLAVAAPRARLHMKSSVFGVRWFRRFSACLQGFEVVYYRFCDHVVVREGLKVQVSPALAFIGEELERLDLLLTDNQRIVEHDRSVIGVHAERWHCLYNMIPVHARAGSERAPRFRLLWASRLCAQKRPDLLVRIGEALGQRDPRLRIAVAGVAEADEPWLEMLAQQPALEYIGAFADFAELAPDRFDALLYTTAFDGLPNVVLEAMGWGLPVIAPDLGGVAEAVGDGVTGMLLSDDGWDDALVRNYVEAVERLYADWSAACAMGSKGQQLIAGRHCAQAHRARMREIFLQGGRGE
jgi:hypothetical protein